eukprot:9009830-Alexandrium_andersonii.AAC.1
MHHLIAEVRPTHAWLHLRQGNPADCGPSSTGRHHAVISSCPCVKEHAPSVRCLHFGVSPISASPAPTHHLTRSKAAALH